MRDNKIIKEIDSDRCYTVYMHTSPSGKRYIGITSMTIEKRWLNGKGYQNQMFYRAIQKYGWNNFKHEILFENLTKKEAEQKERDLISYYKSNQSKYGYNIENGGSSTGKMSEETKRKISEINKGRFVGRKLTEEWLKNRTLAQTGLKRGEETKQKISDAVSRAVICINDRVVYKSLSEASELTNASIYHISSCCHKDRKGAGTDSDGNYLYWMFYEEYLENEYYNKTNEEIIPKRQRDNKPKSVICLNNKIVYKDMTAATKETGLCKSGISMCCNKKQEYCGKDKNGNPLYWMFYDEYLKRGETDGQISEHGEAI